MRTKNRHNNKFQRTPYGAAEQSRYAARMKLAEDMRVDAQCIDILKDKETTRCVDYFFVAALWCKDPRHETRHMLAGECRGLFRFDKESLGAELLLPMLGDDSGGRFEKAAWKVLKEFRANGEWPKGTQYASG